jgi:hypothetical protein
MNTKIIDSSTTMRDIMLSLSRPKQRTGTITTLTINLVVIGTPKLDVDRLEMIFDRTPIK